MNTIPLLLDIKLPQTGWPAIKINQPIIDIKGICMQNFKIRPPILW